MRSTTRQPPEDTIVDYGRGYGDEDIETARYIQRASSTSIDRTLWTCRGGWPRQQHLSHAAYTYCLVKAA
jgi:hypothetical protein